MPKWFNTAGPCRPDNHYMVPAIARLPPTAQAPPEAQPYRSRA